MAGVGTQLNIISTTNETNVVHDVNAYKCTYLHITYISVFNNLWWDIKSACTHIRK